MSADLQSEQSRQLLAAIVDSSDDAIIAKDLNSIITSWNQGARRIFGYDAHEIVGQSVLTLIPPELHAEEPDIIARIRRGERIEHFETRRVTKEGRMVDISLTVSPIRDVGGTIIGASKIARDITERKRVERALTEAQRQLETHAAELEKRVNERTEALRKSIGELEAFSYSLTHDLRAPLRAMQSYLQIFVEDYGVRVGKEGIGAVEKAIISTQRMDRMVLDLLSFTRLSHEEMPVEPVNVEKVIAAICQDRIELQPPQAEIIVRAPLPRMMGNQASLTQCLTNLLDNAVKFVAPGVKPKVLIYAEEAGDSVRLFVHDNGIGLPSGDRKVLFRMFHRVHGSEYAGTGIGLAIVRKAVERMGGQAGVESEPGQGSRFWLQLPKATT